MNKKELKELSQSPQIGSMFLTSFILGRTDKCSDISRNPLKSGQCFLRSTLDLINNDNLQAMSQSPQIGSMFLTLQASLNGRKRGKVAIPSNRVNVSYVLLFLQWMPKK